MFSDVYKTIERKYEDKRNLAFRNYAIAKEKAYAKNPRLAEIDKEITMLGIKSSKAALTTNSAALATLKEELEININLLKQEKEAILSAMNTTLEVAYQCEKCKDTGYILTETGSEMCSCLKQELLNESYNKSNLFRLKNDTFEKFNLTLFSDEANLEKYGVSISPRQNMEKIYQLSMEFIQNFESPEQKNLLFTGTPGIGKTFLSSCIANAVLEKGYTVLYQTSPLLFDLIFENKYGNNKSVGSKEFYDSILSANLLVIDDLGTENLTAARFSELFNLLNARLLKPDVKTIISTNLSLEDLAKTYDDRILSRLIGNYNICRFFGEDIRLKK
ncbi:MAG: ATP-binding protein [Clostridia bacterium]|nr:ATP-binding protein [Clostridia bacterium]